MAEAAPAPAAAAATLPNFEELAHGRVPLATGPSVADTWAGDDGVPRPDKTLEGLRGRAWLGLLGLDHFYLRNPTTGILKLITFGGFLMWWIWDLMQVYTEGPRVVKYGLSTPFDIATGIGQGMIVDGGNTVYGAKSNFSLWQFGSLFSFIGLDSLITKDWARFGRKFMEFIMFIAAGKMVVDNYNGVSGHGIFSVSNLMSTMVVVFFGSIVITNWGLALKNVFSPPGELLSKGIQVDPEINSMLNSYASLMDKLTVIPEEWRTRAKADLNYGSVSPEVMQKKFSIEHKDELKRDAAAAAAAAGESPTSNWLRSVLIWMLMLLGLIAQIGFWAWKALIFGLKSMFKGPVLAAMDEMQAKAAAKIMDNVELASFTEGKVMGMMGMPQQLPHVPTSLNPLARVVHQGQILSAPQSVGVGIPVSGTSTLAEEAAARVSAAIAEGERKRIAREAAKAAAAAPSTVNQAGGARREPSGLSTDAMALGAVVAALVGGGALKAVIDYIVSE